MNDSDAEVEDLPTNWGRWGTNDDHGTLNFITDEARARGVAEATSGQVVSLAMPITPVPLGGGFGFPSGQPMPAPVTQIMNFTSTPAAAFTDMLLINVHHVKSTHIDALAHVNSDGRVYPGVPVDEAIAGGTVQKSSSAPFTTGVTTRGVLLDLAPGGSLEDRYEVTGADFEQAEERSGVRVESGDALIVRGGWNVSENPIGPMPYLTLDAVTWMAEREVSLYAGDLCDEPPIRPGSLVVHQVALARLGMPLIDGAEVDELARTCQSLGRYSFLFVLGTIPVSGATGLPVNPLAIF
jgi:kynurenine formamidase